MTESNPNFRVPGLLRMIHHLPPVEIENQNTQSIPWRVGKLCWLKFSSGYKAMEVATLAKTKPHRLVDYASQYVDIPLEESLRIAEDYGYVNNSIHGITLDGYYLHLVYHQGWHQWQSHDPEIQIQIEERGCELRDRKMTEQLDRNGFIQAHTQTNDAWLGWDFEINPRLITIHRDEIEMKLGEDDEQGCAGCQFLNRSAYLKCAVNPLSAEKKSTMQ